MLVELQEGKERMRRKHFVDDYGATTACTVRMLHKMGMSETNLETKLKRVVTADSWFASLKTAKAVKNFLGMEFTGPIKTSHSGFPIEAIRWALTEKQRGEHVVFKLQGEDVWAIGWNDVHFKCYITTHGTDEPGPQANKKRQRLDGRSYNIKVNRPSIIAHYNEQMGWVDRHNRFRQDILGLHRVWKTKRWQTRIQLEMLGMALVDTFLLARKFIPKWATNDDEQESAFNMFLRALVPQFNDTIDLNRSSAQESRCVQVLIGKRTVAEGKQAGNMYAKQRRCQYCKKQGRKEVHGNGKVGTKSPRTAYTCIAHPDKFMCVQGKSTCWSEHMVDCVGLINAEI
jgi:hypothetical protein